MVGRTIINFTTEIFWLNYFTSLHQSGPVSVNEGLELPNIYDDVFVTSDLYVTTHNPPN